MGENLTLTKALLPGCTPNPTSDPNPHPSPRASRADRLRPGAARGRAALPRQPGSGALTLTLTLTITLTLTLP